MGIMEHPRVHLTAALLKITILKHFLTNTDEIKSVRVAREGYSYNSEE